MNHSKEVSKTDKSNPIDEYFQCLSYCDIHPKGIDNDCEGSLLLTSIKLMLTKIN